MDHWWWYYECFGTSCPILIVLTGYGSLMVILWVFWYILPHTSSQAMDHSWWYYECFGTSYPILIVLTCCGSLTVILWVFWYILPHTYCPHRLWIIDGDTMSVLIHPIPYLLSSHAVDHWWWYYECFGTSYPIFIVLTGCGSLMVIYECFGTSYPILIVLTCCGSLTVILWVFWYILSHTYCPHRLWIINGDTMSVLVHPTPY